MRLLQPSGQSGRAAFARGPHSPEESFDQRHILDPRGAFHAGRDVDAGRVRKTERVADIGCVETTRKHVIDVPVKGRENAPVEGNAVAAGKVGANRWPGVEQESV